MHDRFHRLPVIVVSGKERMIQSVLIFDDTAGTQGIILSLPVFPVRNYDSHVFIGGIVFRRVQRERMVSRSAVTLICQIEDIHLPFIKERHRITDEGKIRTRENHCGSSF